MENKLKVYKNYRAKIKALNYALDLINWDSETVAPSGCFEERGEKIEILTTEVYNLMLDKEYINTVEYLYSKKESLDELLKTEIIKVKEDIKRAEKIPVEEVAKYSKLLNDAQNVWRACKKKCDYETFCPYLEKIFNFNIKKIKYLETDNLKGYDVLLDEYEKGITQKEYDVFFDSLKRDLVPFVKKVINKKLKYNDSFTKETFPIEKQRLLSDYIMELMCFDKTRGVMGEVEHPFTSGTSSRDVRVTNHYYENRFDSGMFSAIHELGHATYEQNVNPLLDETFLNGGASMALHESQSRFYENIIGRSYAFSEIIFDKLKELFPNQLKDTTINDYYKYINTSVASFIRTDADELTYPLHIMLRYEMEKKLITGEIKVKDAEVEWNKLFKEYFGLEVKSASEGILQDVHWGNGLIGYFPTYAYGSGIASQLYYKMKQDFDVEESLKEKNTRKINEWLKEKIHKFGSSMNPKTILKNALEEEFNPQYYIKYLKDKYSKIYNIEE